MPRKFMVPLLTAAFLAAPMLALTTAHAEVVFNPNEHKLNTGNVTAHNPGNGNGQPGMAVKNGGIPQNTATKTGPNSHKTEPSNMEMPNFGK
jgi:hypothetical protein